MSTSKDSPHDPVWKLWTNPILRRYCRSRLRRKTVFGVLLLDLLVCGFIVAMAASIGSRPGLAVIDIARATMIPLLVFQYIILFMLGTVQASGGMIAERDEGMIDYQRLIPMTPLAKTLGYLFGLPAREYLMFLGSLPFSIWAIVAGRIPFDIWAPLYGVMITSAILYHLTGLITGTVVRNRRVAFLFSIGIVFALYTVVPQAARFGLVFFDYLTIRPVFEESLPAIVPRQVGTAIEVVQRFAPKVKFFNLGFSETVFTLFTQAGLALTMLVMLCRKWRSDELHLLSKPWAIGLFAWIHILLLGNALPLIKPGLLFPSREFAQMVNAETAWQPQIGEAMAMSGLYGLVTLLLIGLLTTIITATVDHQKKGWRRAFQQGRLTQPATSDSASSWWYVVAMAVAGGLAWFHFTCSLYESRWFPDGDVAWTAAPTFIAVLLASGLLMQSILEARGQGTLKLVVILVGVVPLLVGAVLTPLDGGLPIWVFPICPLVMPFYASGSLLDPAEMPGEGGASLPYALWFWLLIALAAAFFMTLRLRKLHRERAATAKAQTAGDQGA